MSVLTMPESVNKDALFLEMVKHIPEAERLRTPIVAAGKEIVVNDISLFTLTWAVKAQDDYNQNFASFCECIDLNLTQPSSKANDTSTLIFDSAFHQKRLQEGITITRLNYTTFWANHTRYDDFAPCILQGFSIETNPGHHRRYYIQIILKRFDAISLEHQLAFAMGTHKRLGHQSWLPILSPELVQNEIMQRQRMAHANKRVYRVTTNKDTVFSLLNNHLLDDQCHSINKIFINYILTSEDDGDFDTNIDFIVYPTDKDYCFVEAFMNIHSHDPQGSESDKDGSDDEDSEGPQQPALLDKEDEIMLKKLKQYTTQTDNDYNTQFAVEIPYESAPIRKLVFDLLFQNFFDIDGTLHIRVHGIGFNPDDKDYGTHFMGSNYFRFFIKKCISHLEPFNPL